jgi:hypothetical protein
MIEVKPDDRFERHGDDLLLELPVSFSQAALGTTAMVPSPYGEESLAVPHGTKSGTVLRLRGKGLPRLGGAGTGDLNVKVFIWTPDELNDVQRDVGFLGAGKARHGQDNAARSGGVDPTRTGPGSEDYRMGIRTCASAERPPRTSFRQRWIAAGTASGSSTLSP